MGVLDGEGYLKSSLDKMEEESAMVMAGKGIRYQF